MTSLIAAVLLVGWPGTQQKPQEFLGARSVLSRMLRPLGGSALAEPQVVLKDDLNSFGRGVASMPDQDAATQWLALLHRNWDLTTNDTFGFHGNQVSQVLADLPSPGAWPILAAQIKSDCGRETGRTSVLRLLFQVLQGDNAAALTTVTQMEAYAAEASRPGDFSRIRELLARRMRDPDALEAALKAEQSGQAMRGGPSRDVSDLVPLLGVPRAKELLTYFLLNDKAEISFSNYGAIDQYSDRATIDLALEIALAHVDELAYPQWTLASSPDAGNLFERLASRFPRITYGIADGNPMMWSTIQGAEVHCLINLFMSGKTAEARTFGEKYADSLSLTFFGGVAGGSLADRLIQTGKLASFLDFLADLAVAHPNSQLPMLVMSFAQGNAPPAQTEKFLRRLLAGPKPRNNADWFKGQLQAVLLEQGKFEEVANMVGGPSDGVPGSYGYAPGGLVEALGAELHRPDLITLAQNRRNAAVEGDLDFASDEVLLAGIKRGRGPAIEQHLIKNLRIAVEQNGKQSSTGTGPDALSLMRFYALIGRYQDAVTLLDKFPNWNSPDIRWIVNAGDADFCAAARALAKVGRRDEALRILHFELDRAPTDDNAYELLLEVDPEHAAKTLSALAAENPLLAQPTLYLAEFALHQGRLSEAEKYARQAIALNPQDVQSWVGPRKFKAQKLLAVILKKTGKVGEAKRLAGYPRVAETMQRADDLAQMNLLGPAIRLYRQAVSIAPELFEPRRELGICEIRQGSVDAGRRDIEAACALLPAACGGSTWAPIGDIWTSRLGHLTAVDALKALVKHGTKNPTILGSLGALYLRDGEPAEAIRCYRAAVEIDPNCLIAWSGLSNLLDLIPNDLANKVQSNCIRLFDFPSVYSTAAVPDYAACWRESALANGRRLDVPESVFTLRASRDTLARSRNSVYANRRSGMYGELETSPPAARIANDPLIREIGSMLERG
jgi:tetratricopeptide (TPR) repeat protein